MIGVYILIFFIGCGWFMAQRLFSSESWVIRYWAGTLLGVLGLMWSVIPFAFLWGFSYVSHFAAMIFMALLTAGVVRFVRFPPSSEDPASRFSVPVLIAASGIIAIILSLMYWRTLTPKNGGYYAGLMNFSDMPFHLGIITSILEQKTFPPQYSIFAGVRLAYPFLVDSMSSSLGLFGLELRWSVLLPNFILAVLVVIGFVILARDILGRAWSALLAAVLFFLNGGFGFVYFVDGYRKDPQIFKRIVQSSMFTTPASWWEKDLFLGNTIANALINQRTTLAGWVFLFFFFWLLYRGLTRGERKYFALSGLIGGLMPMIHSVSFLSLSIVAVVWFVSYLFVSSDKKTYLKNWLIFILPFLALASFQLIIWILPHGSQTSGKFMQFHFNSLNSHDLWFWFWIKNAGLLFLFLIPAIVAADRAKLFFYLPAIFIFVFGEAFALSSLSFDNNKIFLVWYVFSAILAAGFLVEIFDRMKGIRGRGFLLGMVIFFCTFSSLLTFVHDLSPGQSHEVFNPQQVKAAAFILENTPADALFVSNDFHNNPITSLAGRTILCGYWAWMASFGINDQERKEDVRVMYAQPERFPELQRKYGVDYVYFSGWEKDKYQADSKYFDEHYPRIFREKDIQIYAVSPRAMSRIKAIHRTRE